MNKTIKTKTQRGMVFRLYTPKTRQTNKNIKNIININTKKMIKNEQKHNKTTIHTTKHLKTHNTNTQHTKNT